MTLSFDDELFGSLAFVTELKKSYVRFFRKLALEPSMIENRRRPSAEAAGVDHSGPQFRRLELERATFFEPELSPILCAPVKILIIFKLQ